VRHTAIIIGARGFFRVEFQTAVDGLDCARKIVLGEQCRAAVDVALRQRRLERDRRVEIR
jgi:hypothetical protein